MTLAHLYRLVKPITDRPVFYKPCNATLGYLCDATGLAGD